jgi:hypothetical protein
LNIHIAPWSFEWITFFYFEPPRPI